jgi:hypothetical protein
LNRRALACHLVTGRGGQPGRFFIELLKFALELLGSPSERIGPRLISAVDGLAQRRHGRFQLAAELMLATTHARQANPCSALGADAHREEPG